MDRREFFRLAGLGGLAALWPARSLFAGETATPVLARTAHKDDHLESGNKNGVDSGSASDPVCTLTPQETVGPYPLNLSSDTTKFRRDIKEGKSGIPLKVRLKLININEGCAPITDARIDLWHCDKDGYYSGYINSGYLGTRVAFGETFCRGIQLTDAQGEVTFETIYPGWYSGRVQHLHFQVFLNSILSATSQLAFPESLNTAVNNSFLYWSHGQNPTKNTNDAVFSDSDNTAYQTAAVEFDSEGYLARLTIAIAVPTTGLMRLTPETGGQFRLGAVRPNPFAMTAEIPFWLAQPSDVRLDVYDLQGRRVMGWEEKGMGVGDRSFWLNRAGNASALRTGSYAFQITVRNEAGVHSQARLLTVA
jgi:protocatechuate 3,4-dioxygenase beta subunit